METNLLNLSPAIVKAMSFEELETLANSIRDFIIEITSQHGGHTGANTGVVELSIALHYIFDSPSTPILWDTSHQGYTHRILTGQATNFLTLNQWGGGSRFIRRRDSEHNIIDASHSGTGLPTAVGLAHAMRLGGDSRCVVVVVGDGAMGEGSTWESLNYLAGTDLPVIVVLNQNGYAIPPTVGGIRHIGQHFFTDMGLQYVACSDGHDLRLLCSRFQEARLRAMHGPIVVHCKTEKGRGLPYAKDHAYRFHFSMPFDAITGIGASPTVVGRTYVTVAAETLADILASDPRVIILTPATPYASGLETLMERFCDRIVDTGMAEQFMVSMAAGLALKGQKPVVCIQSTFLQKAYDAVLHDICAMDLPVTFLISRSGFAGWDSETAHGLWDIPVLSSFPRMQLHYAMEPDDLQQVLRQQLAAPRGPLALLMPYEPLEDTSWTWPATSEGFAVLHTGTTGTVFCLGNTAQTAMTVRDIMHEEHNLDYGVVCVGRLHPLPVTALRHVLRQLCPQYVTIEEGAGGFGALLRRALDGPYVGWLHCDTRGLFVPPGTKEECAVWAGLAPRQIVKQIGTRFGTPVSRVALLAGQDAKKDVNERSAP